MKDNLRNRFFSLPSSSTRPSFFSSFFPPPVHMPPYTIAASQPPLSPCSSSWIKSAPMPMTSPLRVRSSPCRLARLRATSREHSQKCRPCQRSRPTQKRCAMRFNEEGIRKFFQLCVSLKFFSFDWCVLLLFVLMALFICMHVVFRFQMDVQIRVCVSEILQ